jgi:hypothetical protein
MSEVLAQYVQRSPRYILLPQDQCLIRVAGPKQTPWEEGTEIRNISNTGLCFTAPDILLPRFGEYIRVQFDVPGSQQMACHAKVVRIDKAGPDISLIGIEFEALNAPQHLNLTKGLGRKKINENASVIEINTPRNLPRWLSYLFFASVGLSLFFSAFLLFTIFRFLADPFWMEKMSAMAMALWTTLNP